MAIRQNEAMGFVDAALDGMGSTRSAALLERLDRATPWGAIVAPILALPEYASRRGSCGRGRGGRPAWDPTIMLKALMLAKWFNLSDSGLEEALKDRISFRRFVGLSFTDATPDETSFVRFRARLREADLHEHIFASVLGHIERQGLLVREGTMVDAVLVEQSRGRRRDGQNNKDNDDSNNSGSTRDTDASFTKKHGRTHHGYKGHIACDRSGIVTDYRFGTAKEHDSKRIDELTERESVAVIADSAYASHERRARLHERGVLDAIIYKRHRGQAELPGWQREWNRVVSKMRAVCEHPFAMLKQQFGWRRVRYRGMQRNAFDFTLLLTACNIKRSLSLMGEDVPLSHSVRGSPDG